MSQWGLKTQLWNSGIVQAPRGRAFLPAPDRAIILKPSVILKYYERISGVEMRMPD